LKPLGHPARNATKFFATQALEQLRQDEKWLARASDAICEYWRGTKRPQPELRTWAEREQSVQPTHWPKWPDRFSDECDGNGMMHPSVA
jgi:hypothetical protein